MHASHFESEYILGRKLSFYCKAQGFPRPRITWLKDGIELYEHPFFQVSYCYSFKCGFYIAWLTFLMSDRFTNTTSVKTRSLPKWRSIQQLSATLAITNVRLIINMRSTNEDFALTTPSTFINNSTTTVYPSCAIHRPYTQSPC